MAFEITEWNINPNRNWYVVISDSGSDIQVDLYTTQADAEGEDNLVASGSGAYGTSVGITLSMDADGTPEISLFNSDADYHMLVTGGSGDSTVLFHMAPFIDLGEINNGIYKSAALIQARAQYEINSHTNVAKERAVGLAGPFEDIGVGDVVRIQSTRIGLDVLTTVTETAISGTPDSLTAQINTVEYIGMVYNG